MSDYLQIARAYLGRTTAWVWCFLFLCLVMVSVDVQELAGKPGAGFGGILSRKSYLAMFAYFNACLLGVLLRDNIAHPWATLLPNYRRKHLLVTAFIALLFLAIPMLAMEFVGASDVAPTSVAVIFLTCLAAGLWTLHHPALGFLAFPFLIFVTARSSPSSALGAFLAGTTPVASATLAILSLLALWLLAQRLLVFNEEMLEYATARLWGDLLRGRGQTVREQAKAFADHLATLPQEQRAALKNADPLKSRFSNLKQVDNLSGYTERGLWQRLQLWRLGGSPTSPSISVAWLMLFTLVLIPLMVFIPPLAGLANPARNVVVIMSVGVMTNPVNLWLPWFMRLQRLGYESLRPRTRREFVRELGLALLWDTTVCWLGGVLCLGIAAAIWAPELLQIQTLLLFVVCTGAGQLCSYGAMALWFLRRGSGMAASIAYAFCAFMAMEMWIQSVAMNGGISIAVNLAIAAVLAVAGVATIALAYRRWCQADVD